jgi:hypothetical protein
VNVLNPSLYRDTDITSKTAPSDASGPAAPTSLATISQHLKTITFGWTAPADKDVAYYHWEIRTAASGGGSVVVEGNTEGPGTKVTLTFTEAQIAYTTTRYLRILGYDWSGNIGTYSASLSFSFSQVVTGDITDLAITTAKIATANITTAKIADANITTAKIANLAVTSAVIDDLSVTTLKIGGSAVTTPKIIDNAVTASGTYSNDNPVTLSTSSQEIGTLTISTDGGPAVVIAKVEIELAANTLNAGLPTVGVALRKDTIATGTLLDSVLVKFTDDTTESLSVVVTIIGFDSAPSASQTYKLEAFESNSNTVALASGRKIVNFNLKK